MNKWLDNQMRELLDAADRKRKSDSVPTAIKTYGPGQGAMEELDDSDCDPTT
jgi:hypothetical protein